MAKMPSTSDIAAPQAQAMSADAETEMRDFLEAYRAALERGDIDAIAGAYRLPLPVIRPDRLRVVDSPRALRIELERILDFYRWCGMKRIALDRLRFDGDERGLRMACLAWRPIDAKGETVTTIDVSFAIQLGNGAPCIVAVIAHNEEMRRMPLLNAAAQAMGEQPPRPALIAERPDGAGEAGS